MDLLTQQTNRIEQYRIGIRCVFSQYLEEEKSDQYDDTIAICDEKTDNYILMNVGWNGYKRQHGVFVHFRIIDDRIHVEWNGTEDIIEKLMEQGIPKSAFVPAFRHPDFRESII